MKIIEMKRLPPRSEVVDAIGRSARLGEGLLAVARRHGISTHDAFGMLAEAIDIAEQQAYRRGYRSGRLSAMPHLLKVAA